MSDPVIVVIEETAPVIVVMADPDPPAIVVTMPGPRGPQGLPGADGGVGATTRLRVAAGPLSGHRVVVDGADGAVDYADNTDLAHLHLAAGVTSGAAAAGDEASVVMFGQMDEPTWAWTPGDPVYLGTAGALTQSVPMAPAAFLLEVGVALTPTSLFVNPKIPIRVT